MWNPTATGQNTLVTTATSLTLGYGPSQTAPPELLMMNLSAGSTVTLSKINQVGPTAPGTPGTTPATGDGYLLVIKNLNQFTTTITPASGDTCDIAQLQNAGDTCILVADAANSKWRSISGQLVGTASQITTSGTTTTLVPATRYQIVTTATAITIPTTMNTSQPFTIVNESTGSVTLTPASGTINTTAAFTLSTLTSATFFGDGTNFHAVNTK